MSSRINLLWFALLTSSTLTATTGTPVEQYVYPASGQGSRQVFMFTYHHPDGLSGLQTLYAVIGKTSSFTGTCAVRYDTTTRTLALNDNQGGWAAPVRIGAIVPWPSLSNGICTISPTSTTAFTQLVGITPSSIQASASQVY